MEEVVLVEVVAVEAFAMVILIVAVVVVFEDKIFYIYLFHRCSKMLQPDKIFNLRKMLLLVFQE